MSLIGQTIKWHRMRQGMTQEQLSEDICSSAYLSKLENNQISFNKEIVSQLCERLDLPIESYTKEPNEELQETLQEWMEALHRFDQTEATACYEKVQKLSTEHIPVEQSYLYELSLFGHYLLTQQTDRANEKYSDIKSFAWILEKHYAYSYHKFIGSYYLQKLYCSNAINHFKKAEETLKDTSDPELYLLMATAYTRMEKILRSNKYAQKAYQMFQTELDYTRIIICQLILGLNYCLIEDFESAEDYFKKLRSLEENQVGSSIKATIYSFDGILQLKKKDYEQAKVCFEKALEYETDFQVLLISHHFLSIAYLRSGQTDSAMEEARTGIKVAEKYQVDRYQMKLKTILYYLEGRKEELVQLLMKKIIPFFQRLGEDYELFSYHLMTGSLLFEMKRYKDASNHLLAAYEVNGTESVLIPKSKSAKLSPSLPFDSP